MTMAIISERKPLHIPKYLLLWTPNWLKTRYEKDGLSTYQIAELVGCGQSTVIFVMKRLGIHSRKYTMSKSAILARKSNAFTRKPKKEKENADERGASEDSVNG